MLTVIKVKSSIAYILLELVWQTCIFPHVFMVCKFGTQAVRGLLSTWKQCSLQTMSLWLSIKLLSNSCLASLALLLGHQTAFASMKCVSLYSDKSSLIGSSTISELPSTLMSLKILPSLLLHLMIGERPRFVTWLMGLMEILVCPLNRRTSYDVPCWVYKR